MAKEAKKVAGKELKAIRLQAAGWLVRFHGRSMSCVQHVRYLNWLERSPVHFEEMRNALKMRAVLSDARLWDGVRREHKSHARYH